MALNSAADEQLRWWARIAPAWQLAAWLVVFLVLSRLLYLPSSLSIGSTTNALLRAAPGTSLVLEGVGRGEDTVLTIQFDGFRNATVKSDRAGLAPEALALLQSLGLAPPTGLAPLVWSVELPIDATGPSSLTVGWAPASGADLMIGARGGMLEIASNAELAMVPAAQDFPTTIGGVLRLGNFATTATADLVLPMRIVPRDGTARVRLGFSSQPPRFLLGDPFEQEDEVKVRSLAWRDESGRLLRRLCGAPSGRTAWAAFFEPGFEPQPGTGSCAAGYLEATQLKLGDDGFSVRVAGSAYVSGLADWFEKLKRNIVLWPLVAALIALPGTRLIKLVSEFYSRARVTPRPASRPRRKRKAA